MGDWGAGRAHRATANETHRAGDDAAQAVGDCQADRADGGDLPVEEPLEEVGGDQGVVDVKHIADDLQTRVRVAHSAECAESEILPSDREDNVHKGEGRGDGGCVRKNTCIPEPLVEQDRAETAGHRYGCEQGVEPAAVGSRIEAGKARPGDEG